MFAGDEWPSGSYGLPSPKSGREGWRFQDMENNDKSISERSRVSSGSHMDVTLVGDKKDVNRTFCMKQNTGTQTRFWPKGKVLDMHTLTTYDTAMHMLQYELQGYYSMNSRDITV
jgi:hypothetical protein